MTRGVDCNNRPWIGTACGWFRLSEDSPRSTAGIFFSPSGVRILSACVSEQMPLLADQGLDWSAPRRRYAWRCRGPCGIGRRHHPGCGEIHRHALGARRGIRGRHYGRRRIETGRDKLRYVRLDRAGGWSRRNLRCREWQSRAVGRWATRHGAAHSGRRAAKRGRWRDVSSRGEDDWRGNGSQWRRRCHGGR